MYTVQKILAQRQTKKKGKFQYLVKWEGWEEDQSTWEPQVNLRYVKKILDKFKKQLQSHSEAQPKLKNSECRDRLESPIDDQKRNRAKKKDYCDRSRKKTTISAELIEKQNASELFEMQKCLDENQNQNEPEKLISGKSQLIQHELNQKQITWNNSVDPPHQTSVQNKTIKILGMKKDQNNYWYYVNEGGEEAWCLRDYVIEKFPAILCEFYEARLVFD